MSQPTAMRSQPLSRLRSLYARRFRSVSARPGMTAAESARDQLDAVAAHLAARRDALLQRWREAADADPELTTASALSRAQFFDHIPEVLDALRADARAPATATSGRRPPQDQREGAAGHGMHRWQQGYRQREAMREWRHLHLCLVDELEAFSLAHPETVAEAMSAARRALAELCSDGVCESADQYQQLQRSEAAGRVRELDADARRARGARGAPGRDAARGRARSARQPRRGDVRDRGARPRGRRGRCARARPRRAATRRGLDDRASQRPDQPRPPRGRPRAAHRRAVRRGGAARASCARRCSRSRRSAASHSSPTGRRRSPSKATGSTPTGSRRTSS